MIGESGLAGLNRRLEVRKAAWQVGAYAALAFVTVVGVIVLSVSARRNSTYVSEVGAALVRLREVPPVARGRVVGHAPATPGRRPRPCWTWRSSTRRRALRGACGGGCSRDGAGRLGARTPTCASSTGRCVPRVAARLRERLIENRRQPDALYEYLKAYLMLGDPARLDKPYLHRVHPGRVAERGRRRRRRRVADEALREPAGYGDDLRPVAVDATVIAQARSSIRQASIPQNHLRTAEATLCLRHRARRPAGRLRGRGAPKPCCGAAVAPAWRTRCPGCSPRRCSPRPPRPPPLDLVKQFSADSWVWGDTSMFSSNPLRLAADVINLYEREYVQAWEAVLNDLDVPSFSNIEQLASALEVLSGAASPLRGVLSTIVQETTLVETSRRRRRRRRARSPPRARPSPIWRGRSSSRCPRRPAYRSPSRASS